MKRLLTALLFAASFPLFSQSLYDTDQTTIIEITFEEDNWDEILDGYFAAGEGERLMALVEINGTSFDSVGVRYRGGSTHHPDNAKNPLNIKLDYLKNQDFEGFDVLKLSNGAKDPSWLREVMGFEILRNYMEAPAANYASVYVNGNFHGLYANVESINSKFFAERFLSDPDNPRFECAPSYGFDENPAPPAGCSMGHGAALEFLGSGEVCYFQHYEIKSTLGWPALRDMTNALATSPSTARDLLDLDRFHWMSAFNSLTANLDSYLGASPRNYFVFKTGNGKWAPVMNDLNECFARFPWATVPQPGDPQPGLSFYTELDPFFGAANTEKPLFAALFDGGRNSRMYVAHLRTMIDEMFTSGLFEQRAEDLRNLIADEVAADDNHFYTVDEFNQNWSETVIDSYDGEDAYGLFPLMNGRILYLLGLPEFQATPPTISGVSASPNMPTVGQMVNVTATVSGGSPVILGHRGNRTEAFQWTDMLDDGMHGDGTAGDGVFGASLTAEVGGFQYYVYAENADAGMFSPPRAEFEFYEVNTSGSVAINEIMARNQTTVADPNGQFDDWAEIFNNTPNAVTLTGWFLSDDLANPQKWAFPTGVSLAPGQFLTVWLDDDEQQPGLHTSFNLNGDGEELLLSMPDGTVVDQIVFGAQQPDISLGRCPDGTGPFVFQPPSFGTSNNGTCVNATSNPAVEFDLHIFPNPVSKLLNITSNLERPVSARLVSPFGQMVRDFRLSSSTQVEVGDLPGGIYFLETEGRVLAKVSIVE